MTNLEIANGQNFGSQNNGSQLSSVPYYIIDLKRKMDSLNYKLNKILEILESQNTEESRYGRLLPMGEDF